MNRITGILALLVLAMLGPIACHRVDTASLLPLMETDLSRFAAEIQDQLESERTQVEAQLEAPSAAAELAESMGRLGRLYHAYGLHPPASVCYRNAITLAPDDARWPYLLGVVQQTDGELEDAAGQYEVARRLLPEITDAESGDSTSQDLENALVLRLATVYSDLTRDAEAEALLLEVLERNDGVAQAHFHLGRLAAARGDDEEAIQRFERTLDLQPQATTAHYVLGVAYRRLGDESAAQRHVDAMGAVPPSFADPWVEELDGLILGIGPHLDRAQAAVESGRFEEAEREYQAALDLEANNSTALRGLGYTLRKAGRLQDSVDALRHMLTLYPKDTAARLELATTLLEDGRLDASIAEFDTLVEIDPSFELAYLNQGVALSRLGRWPAAIERFRKVLELDPKDRSARYHLAVALDATGRPEESVRSLQALALEFPQWVEVRQRLGLELLKSGDLDAAHRQHEAVLEVADAPDQEKALAHYQLAQIAERRQDLDGALEHYAASRSLFPGLWQAALSYGNTLRRAGRFVDAASQYRSLVDGQPDQVHHRVLEIEALVLGGDAARAAQRLEEGLKALPRAAELGHLKARLLATAPDGRLRNGELAFSMAKQIFDAFPSLEHGRTVAMALAEQGRFPEALSWQQQLIEQAQREQNDLLPRLRQDFDGYARGEPVRRW